MTNTAIFCCCFPKRKKQWTIIIVGLLITLLIFVYLKPSNNQDNSSIRKDKYKKLNNQKKKWKENDEEEHSVPLSKFLYPDQNSTSLISNPEQARVKAISNTLTNINKCMQISNLTSPALLETAKQNAQLFMEQYGSVISPQYLDDYVNYCWNTDYHLVLDEPFMKGQIDGRSFKRRISKHWFGEGMKNYFEYHWKKHTFSTVCLPNIYLLGFEKCGSTFFWCLLSRMLNKHIQSKSVQADKEPYYWTPFDYKPALPSPQKLSGEYIPNFLMASDRYIPEKIRKNMALIDGCPSTVLEWPQFNESEPELANYCLLPSALPELFPHSKYLVIIREPVSMMYSAFWWSFTAAPRKSDILSKSVINDLSRGPLVFHLHAGKKITKFLNCINSDPTVQHQKKCTLWGKEGENYASCISNRTHLLSQCVANITTKREFLEAVIHRGIYYVHVRKWLQTLPRERIFFTTEEKLKTDTYTVLYNTYNFIKGSTSPPSSEHIEDFQILCRKNTNKINYKKPPLMMQHRTKIMLKNFFEPFNVMLSDLLQDKEFLWTK